MRLRHIHTHHGNGVSTGRRASNKTVLAGAVEVSSDDLSRWSDAVG